MTSTTIAGQVNAMNASRAGQPVSDVMKPFLREQQRLASRGQPEGVISVGSMLPDATLLDPQGEPTRLYDAIGGRLAVIVFYRGAWCPYCNIALRTYQTELVPELTRQNVALIAVSPQAPDGSLSMQQKNELTFTVLSDPANALAGHVGIVSAPSPDAVAAQLQLGLDLAAVNADSTAAIPMPTTLIVDPDRVVRWVDVHPDYTTRSEPAEILAALDTPIR
jgi:peroxiredoxin